MLNSQLQVICTITADYSIITVYVSISSIITLLFISELQVWVDPAIATDGDRVTLTCNTTCSLIYNLTYNWYKNLHAINSTHTTGNMLIIPSVSIEDTGSYSCAVKGHEVHRSLDRTLSVRCKYVRFITSFVMKFNIIKLDS